MGRVQTPHLLWAVRSRATRSKMVSQMYNRCNIMVIIQESYKINNKKLDLDIDHL